MKIVTSVLTLAFVLTAFTPSMAMAKQVAEDEIEEGEEEERMSGQGLLKRRPKEERKKQDEDKKSKDLDKE